jgi:hypothetical protein
MVEAKTIFKLEIHSILTWLVAQEGFIAALSLIQDLFYYHNYDFP